MKTLYMIGGTMGVGKTTVCRYLEQELPNAVFLDGDWCWDMNPFQVTTETKALVTDNITYLLNNFLRCSVYENVIFCWVLHEQAIWDAILSKLTLADVTVYKIALVCDAVSLEERLQKDVQAGIRQADVIARSLARIPLYTALDVYKLNVSDINAKKASEEIRRLAGEII